MEVRQVPSAFSIASLATQVLGTHHGPVEAHPDQKKPAAHAPKTHAAKHHRAVKHAHAHHAPKSNSSSNQNNLFSNFFKSVFGI
jgi:hypothetical protein